MKTILVAICLLITSGCMAQYKDVSDQQEYKPLLNTNYILVKEMTISGVNTDPGYGKDIDIYVIDPIDFVWKGPELITRETLPKGAMITIQKIMKCINCFDGSIKAIVKIEPFEKKAEVPIYIKLDHVKSGSYMHPKG